MHTRASYTMGNFCPIPYSHIQIMCLFSLRNVSSCISSNNGRLFCLFLFDSVRMRSVLLLSICFRRFCYTWRGGIVRVHTRTHASFACEILLLWEIFRSNVCRWKMLFGIHQSSLELLVICSVSWTNFNDSLWRLARMRSFAEPCPLISLDITQFTVFFNIRNIPIAFFNQKNKENVQMPFLKTGSPIKYYVELVIHNG